MHLPNQKSINIDGIDMKELYIDGTLIWKSGYKNWVKFSTEADGKTIYNGGLGYKDGYRVRSGGAEGSASAASCIGYIPVKAGDVIRLSGYDASYSTNANAINVYDGSHTNLGQVVANSPTDGYGIFTSTRKDYNWGNANGVKEETEGVYVWTIPPDESIAYIRVTGYSNNGKTADGSKMIVTINEEIS